MQTGTKRARDDLRKDTKIDHLILLANEPKLVCAVADIKGRRPTMEDTHINSRACTTNSLQKLCIFAVCDGHGGTTCATYLQKNLAKHVSSLLCGKNPRNQSDVSAALKSAFAQCQAAFENHAKDKYSGSTCCLLVLFENEQIYYVASCGDSRAIAFESLLSPQKATQITSDHKPETKVERQRIEAAGGSVVRTEYFNDVDVDDETDPEQPARKKTVMHRVNGIMAVARSFGDVFLRPFLSEVPDVFGPFDAKKNAAVLLACDGAFECNTTAQLCDEVALIAERCAKEEIKLFRGGGTRNSNANTRRVLAIANGVCQYAYRMGSEDNVTAVCVQFI